MEQTVREGSFEEIVEGIQYTMDRVKDVMPNSRERSLVLTKLQEAELWLKVAPREER